MLGIAWRVLLTWCSEVKDSVLFLKVQFLLDIKVLDYKMIVLFLRLRQQTRGKIISIMALTDWDVRKTRERKRERERTYSQLDIKKIEIEALGNENQAVCICQLKESLCRKGKSWKWGRLVFNPVKIYEIYVLCTKVINTTLVSGAEARNLWG